MRINKEKLKKLAIMNQEPFLYDWIDIATIQTMQKGIAAISKSVLYLSDSFFGLPEKEQIGVLYHEILHRVYNHHNRTQQPNRKKANVAQDIIINETLELNNYTLPQFGVFRRTLNVPTNLRTSQEIYDWLPESSISLANMTEVEMEDQDNDESSEQIEIERNIDDMLSDKAIRTRKNIKLEDPIPWDLDLEINIGRLIKRELGRNWQRSNRRIKIESLLLPHNYHATQIPKINLYIDTSGSMEGIIGYVVSSIEQIKNRLKQYEPNYYGFNTEIYPVNSLGELKVGGGTSFSSLVGTPDLHVIITDGELDWSFIDGQKKCIAYLVRNNKIYKK